MKPIHYRKQASECWFMVHYSLNNCEGRCVGVALKKGLGRS